MLKKALIDEINVYLQRNDLSHIDFIYLHGLETIIGLLEDIRNGIYVIIFVTINILIHLLFCKFFG